MRILLLCILISLAICHQQSDHRVSFEPRLQFHNKNGSGLKPEQLSFFVQVANYASKVYGDDIEKNLKYIKAKMDSAYGMGSAAFQVFIQTDQEVVNWSIMVLVQSIYAAVEGINELYPKWSYFFGLYVGSQNIAEYVYFHGGMGSGFTQNLIDTATTAVLEQEEPQCGCGTDGLKSIENALYAKTMNSWSIICSNLNNTYSLIRSYQDQWITIRPRNCYYTIFS